MKTKQRVLLIVVGLASAVFILGLSLTSSVMSAHSSTGIMGRTFYVADKILPDHITYPVLMIIDRARLETATPLEKIYLMTEYANRRLVYASELYNKAQYDLAVTTLTKAQKYLLYAGGLVLNEHNTDKHRFHVAKTIEYHLKYIDQTFHNEDLSDEHRAAIDKLNEELKVVHGQLL
jgi:flagellin-specific chaperone FliS